MNYSTPFRIKDIKSNNLWAIQIENQSSDRSYGRRFRIYATGSALSEDVVLKHILKRTERIAKKILKNPKSAKELQDLKKFITHLRSVETKAQAEYDSREECLYKFRTWFHRLFNYGSHLKRLDSLEAKVDAKLQAYSAEAAEDERLESLKPFLEKEPPQKEEYTLDEALIEPLKTEKELSPISAKQLDLLKSILPNQQIIQEKGKKYLISNAFNQIEVSQKNGKTLTITTSPPGFVESIQCDDVDTGMTIPDEFSDILTKIFYDGLCKKCVYDYSQKIFIVIKTSLQSNPAWHLKQWKAHHIIGFIKEDGSLEPGADAGGVTRDYLDTLIESLTQDRALFYQFISGLSLPHIDRKVLNRGVSVCSQEEHQVFYQLGRLLHFCYKHNSVSTGCYFSDALFHVMTALTYDEIQTAFQDLELATHIKLAKALFKEWDLGNDGQLKHGLEKALDLLDITCLNQCLLDNDMNALGYLYTAAGCPEGFGDVFGPDLEKINANLNQFRSECEIGLFRNTELLEQLNGASLGSFLAPIHAIAQGFANGFGEKHAQKKWTDIQALDPLKLSKKVQGTIDRAKILSKIQNSSPGSDLDTKFTWLTDWIADETYGATDQEIKQFLKFVTGTSALNKEAKIKVQVNGDNSPIPTASTCFYKIKISPKVNGTPEGKTYPDGDREGFIQCLREAIATTDFGMT